MRKNVHFLIIFVLSYFIFLPNASALSCSNKDANDLVSYASYVKAKYDIIDNSKRKTAKINGKAMEYAIPNFTFNITIYNVTDNIYLKITNDVNEQEIVVYNKDTNKNTYTFSNYDFGQIYNYTIEILSNNPSCKNESIRKINLTKPKYNVFSEYSECNGSKLAYCQKFISTNKKINLDEFSQMVDLEKDESEDSRVVFLNFVIKNKNKFIITLILLSIIVVLMIIIVILRRIKERKEEW